MVQVAKTAPAAVAASIPLAPRVVDTWFSLTDDTRGGQLLQLIAMQRFGTSLFDFTLDHPAVMRDDAFARDVTRQLLLHFHRLHSAGWAHRDMKPHNALIELTDEGAPLVMLCDLGSVRRLHMPADPVDPKLPPSTPYVTSRFYRAPELLCGSSSYTTAVDIWALAVTIAEVYMLAAGLTDMAAAKTIAYSRGEGRPSRDAAADSGTAGDGASTARGAGGGLHTLEHKRKAQNCTIFHGVTNDGSQLAHIINLLGTPTEADIADLRLSARTEPELRLLCEIIIAQAARKEPPTVSQTWLRKQAAATAAAAAAGGGDVAMAASASGGRPAPPALGGAVAVSPPGTQGGAGTRSVPAAGGVDLDRDGIPPIDMRAYLVKRSIPADMADLLARMLQWSPKQRITAGEALEHPAMLTTIFTPPGHR